MRKRVCILSAFTSLVGWGGAALIWLVYGHPAGVRPDFFIALSVGMTGNLAWVINRVMPDQAALYALGYRDGVQYSRCQCEPTEHTEPAKRHLSSV